MTTNMAVPPRTAGLFAPNRAAAPLPPGPDYEAEGELEDHYNMDGFNDNEFSDDNEEDYENGGPVDDSDSDGDDYLEPEGSQPPPGRYPAERVSSFSKRSVPAPPPTRGALPTPSPVGQMAAAPVPSLPPPRGIGRPAAPPPPAAEEEQEDYEDPNKTSPPSLPPPRPGLRTPPEPEEQEMYEVVAGGESNNNKPQLPPMRSNPPVTGRTPNLPPPRPASNQSRPPSDPTQDQEIYAVPDEDEDEEENKRGTVYEYSDDEEEEDDTEEEQQEIYDKAEEEDDSVYNEPDDPSAPPVVPNTPRPQLGGCRPALPSIPRSPAAVPVTPTEIYDVADDLLDQHDPTTYECVEPKNLNKSSPLARGMPPLPPNNKNRPPLPVPGQEVYEDPDASKGRPALPPTPRRQQQPQEEPTEEYEDFVDEEAGGIYEATEDIPQQQQVRAPAPPPLPTTPAAPLPRAISKPQKKAQPAPGPGAIKLFCGDETIKSKLKGLRPAADRKAFEKPVEKEVEQVSFLHNLRKTSFSAAAVGTSESPTTESPTKSPPATKPKKPWTPQSPPATAPAPSPAPAPAPKRPWQQKKPAVSPGGVPVATEVDRSSVSSSNASDSGSGVFLPPVPQKNLNDDFPPPPSPQELAGPHSPSTTCTSIPGMPPPPPPTEIPQTPPCTSIPDMPPPPVPSYRAAHQPAAAPQPGAAPCPAANTLESQPWFQHIGRKEAEEKLRALQADGSFLVRKSNKGGAENPYTLTLFFNFKHYNLHVRRRPDNRWALGKEKPDEMSFDNVVELINHHRGNELILTPALNSKTPGGQTVLRAWPPK